ncbi:MAG: fluoride efflux transporter CrcB [Dolichospermum sp. DET50]|nr:fluoride efflux transporter CrcB [Dolichospermum sp. DET66]MBS3035827.1 fluoride efflux transporter CrcB [Dolichospermum sp. DET67]MBS3041030.1 fluoride efflux transporter CrcB [Dolichospermum sp. DET50]QSX68128.1 MAG: fluoride efflux transporter CrcB [Dolichospermum sp. DET69]
MLQQAEIRIPIAISLGAIAGALSRYYLTLWFTNRLGFAFPYGTFFINISGCLAMGFFTTLAMEKTAMIAPEIKLIIATGFLGAYTTFSTFGLDTVGLLQRGHWLAGTGYFIGSTILGIISVQLGMIIARLFN